jgi:hypothetical protein
LLKKVDGSHYDVRVSTREWRTLWMWIESGATFAGSYAGLRNVEEQRLAGMAHGIAWGGFRKALADRCTSCHQVGKVEGKNIRPLPFDGEVRRKNRALAGRPTAAHERIILGPNDPIAKYDAKILVNFTHPAHSPILLGPLAKSAGGFGSCGEVFKDRNDPDYKSMLAGIEKGAKAWEGRPRWGTPGFQPNRQSIREMRKYGILPKDFDPRKEKLNAFEIDQAYWRSFWVGAKKDN